ncbi:uncharacterized protein LOC130258385 [Oenanthe melanoleuca]|uniref:uncharacterized protein LOC130258385 n=1 Tax=Oenanthe melanoleuca TaxID=2939378 RepID=UPI0024C1DAC1|nr:uncharacterized protein LOC130258385 [Oenanthe melanoleuca]
MALALRLFLLLLLAVALPARAAQAAPWPARGAGLPTVHTHDTGDKKSMEADRLLDQMLSNLERRRAMKVKTVLKALFPGGSSGSVPASAAGREAMPGTVTGDEREVSQVAQLHEDLQPLEPPAVTDVSAGKAFPNPSADATQEPSSNPRGSLRRKKKPTGNSEIQDDSNLLDQMLSDLEISREIEEETGLVAPIPRGSSGSVPVSAAGREAMPGTVTGGPPGWNNPDIGDKISLEADRLLDKMLTDLERRRAMKVKTVLKALFPGGSSGSVPASAAGREAMPGTVTGDEREVSQVAQLHEDLQPLEPPAVTDVSAGKAFPNPSADATQEPSSNPRGSLRRKKKPTGNSEIQDDSNLLDQMLSDLEIRREIEEETGLVAPIPRGSSGSVPVSAAGREAMPGTVTGGPPGWNNPDIGDKKSLEADRLLDKMLTDLERRRAMKVKTVLKALFPGGSSGSVPASAAGREAMPGTVTGDEREVSQVAQLHEDLQPLEPPAVTDVSAGKAFPNPSADATQEPSSNPRGSLRRKKKPTGNSEIQDDSNLLDQMLSDLEIHREIEEETGLVAPIPRGSSGSVPVSAAGREAMPGTVTGGPPGWNNPDIGDKKSLEADRLLDKMLTDLERRRAMKVKTVLKALFARGSSGSVPASAAGREAMPGTVTGDEHEVSRAAQLHEDLQPLEPPAVTGVSAGKTFPNPLADATQEPSSNPRGSLRRKKKPTGNSEMLEDSNLLDQMLSDLEIRREIEEETGLVAPIPRGSSGSVPVSAAGREAMPGTVTGGPPGWNNPDIGDKKSLEADRLLDKMLSDLERRRGIKRKPLWRAAFPEGRESKPGTGTGTTDEHVGEGDLASQPTFREVPLGAGEVIEQKSVPKEAFPRGSSGSVPASPAGGTVTPGTGTGTATEDSASTSTHGPHSQEGTGKGFCQDTRCRLKLIAFLVVLDLVFILCCIGIWYCLKRKRSAPAASRDRNKASDGDTFPCHRPSPTQFALALLQLPYQLVAMDLLPPPRTRLCPQRCWPWCWARAGGGPLLPGMGLSTAAPLGFSSGVWVVPPALAELLVWA